jgi:hypothetical protein
LRSRESAGEILGSREPVAASINLRADFRYHGRRLRRTSWQHYSDANTEACYKNYGFFVHFKPSYRLGDKGLRGKKLSFFLS